MSLYQQTVNSAPKPQTYNHSSTERFAPAQAKAPEEETPKKVSYRQKGRKYEGQIIKGTSSAAFINKNLGTLPQDQIQSIPSQIKDTWKKGFGSNSLRFLDKLDKRDQERSPGPGAYLNQQNLNQMLKKTESYSKKGLGNGFISKVDRFKNNHLYFKSYLPGPGSYTASTHSETLLGQSVQTNKLSEKYKNNNLSSVFMPHANKSRQGKIKTPGPGFYFVEQSQDSNAVMKETSSCQAAFRSGSKKCDYINHYKDLINNPSPGQYQFERNNILRKTLDTFNKQRLTSNFVNPLNCKRVKVNLYDPFQKVDSDKKEIPGPGAYNVEKESIAYKNLEKMTTGMFSSVFQKPQTSTSQKGTGKPFLRNSHSQAQLPGPGYYDMEQNKFEANKMPVGSSMFKSDSVRELAMVKRGPGPAFYKNPAPLDPKKQFNFNPGKSWL